MDRLTCANCGHRFRRDQEGKLNWLENIQFMAQALALGLDGNQLGDNSDLFICPACRLINSRCPRTNCQQYIAFPLDRFGEPKPCPRCGTQINT